MGMPTGDSPQTAEQYYDYLQAHHQTDHAVATWHVGWIQLAWLWGFVVVLTLGILFWVWQYRTTLQRSEGREPCIRSTASAATRPSRPGQRRSSSS